MGEIIMKKADIELSTVILFILGGIVLALLIFLFVNMGKGGLNILSVINSSIK